MTFNTAYRAELQDHWRALLAATIGLGFGLGLNAYTASLFGPHLIAEFGWTKSDFALVGGFSMLMVLIQPITGRLVDRHGVKPIAAIGVIGAPVGFLLYALLSGDIRFFYLATIVQMTLGTFTTTPVYARLVAERFDRARGLAFAIVMSGPPIAGFFVAPLLDSVITASGWRQGYLFMGGLTLLFGCLALVLMPGRHISNIQQARRSTADRRADFRRIARSAPFWIIIGGMLLINLPQSLITSQFKLVLVDSGAAPDFATQLIALFATGVIAGRFACGLSLDRMAAHHVAAACLTLPAIGFLLLALPFNAVPLLMLAVILLGFAQGAEGDIVGYLVARHFQLNVFSLVMALAGSSIALSASGGAILLSAVLGRTDNFEPFLYFASAVTLAGALLFLLLGRMPADHGPS